MLQSISLRQFQSHKKTFLDKLSPGVNVIIGQSDSGKTSIVRALKWIWSNRPVGSSMIRHGKASGSAAMVLLPDRIHVVREKGKGINEYRMRTLPIPHEGTKPMVFEAVNTGVPEEVEKALDLQSINFQFQLDPPFMLGLSPIEAAKALNEVAGLDDIDRVLGNLSKMKRRNDDDLRSAVQDRDEAKEELAKLGTIERMSEIANLINNLIRQQNKAKDLVQQQMELTGFKCAIAIATSKVKKLSKWTKADEATKELGQKLDRIQIMEKKWRALQELDRDIDMSQALIETWKAKVERLEKQWHEKMPDQCPLCGQGGKK